MDESAIKGLKSLELNDAHIRKPSLEVEKHFASCGKFLNIRFILDSERRIINSVAFMRIEGEEAEEKALELSGTDVGGWSGHECYASPVLPECGLAYYIDIQGKSCLGKALELSGRNVGGMTLVVELQPIECLNTGRRKKRSYRAPTGYMHPRFLPEVVVEEEEDGDGEGDEKMKFLR